MQDFTISEAPSDITEDNNRQSLSDFLYQTLNKNSKPSPQKLPEPKSPLKEKSVSPSRKKKKMSPRPADKMSPRPADKLESLFKLAKITISKEELRNYEEHDKNFTLFL